MFHVSPVEPRFRASGNVRINSWHFYYSMFDNDGTQLQMLLSFGVMVVAMAYVAPVAMQHIRSPESAMEQVETAKSE
jgi:hypothetical protein